MPRQSPVKHYFTPSKYSVERPVEVLRPLYPKVFTRPQFVDMASKVVTPAHCLEPGLFWGAFRAVHVGEGSFARVAL